MKKIFLLCTLFIASLSFAQELQFEKGRFYVDGNKIKDKEAKAMLANHAPALEQYNKSKEKGAFGGLLLGAGIGLIVADMAMGGYQYNYDYPQSITFVGIGCVALSIPILHGRGKKMKESARLFNENTARLKNASSQIELNFVNNHNGFGLQFQF